MSPSTDQRENREFAAEVKFLLNPEVAERVRLWSRTHLLPDPNANSDQHDGYRITSLYFDTEDFDVFWRKGSFGRSKYRIRRYGAAETVFLERKLKTRGLVSKRRSIVPISQISRLAKREIERGWPGYWYHQRLLLRNLKNVCQISYHRTARVLMTPKGPIRLTLDDDIRTVPTPDMAYREMGEGTPMLDRQIILELKYRYDLPELFKRLAGEFGLKPEPVSKYRLAIAALGYARKKDAVASADSIVCLTS
jgi:hypothetical protein